MIEQLQEATETNEEKVQQLKVVNSEKAYLKKAYDGISKKLKNLQEENYLVPKDAKGSGKKEA